MGLEVQRLRQELGIAEERLRYLELHNAQLKEHSDEIQRKAVRYEHMKHKFLLSRESVLQLQTSLSRMRDDNENAIAKINHLKSENNELQSKNTTLEGIIRALSERNASLSDSLKKAQAESQGAEKNSNSCLTITENESESFQGVQNNGKGEHIQSNKVNAPKQIAHRYDEQIAQLISTVDSLQKKLYAEIEQKDNAQSAREKAEEKLAQSRNTIAELKGLHEQATQSLTNCRHSNSSFSAEVEALQSKVQRLSNVVCQMLHALEEEELLKVEATTRAESLESTMVLLKQENSRLHAKSICTREKSDKLYSTFLSMQSVLVQFIQSYSRFFCDRA